MVLCARQELSCQSVGGKFTNLQYYDSHLIHYGILLGLHSTRYDLHYSDSYVTDAYKDLHSIHSAPSQGFKVGFIVNIRVLKYLDFRILPTVSLYENMLEYKMLDGTTQLQLRDYALFELPLILKVKTVRRGNLRVYLLTGFNPVFEASQKKEIDLANTLLKTEKRFASLEFGVGLDIYMTFFKLAPELRYSHGLQNVLSDDANWYNQALKDLRPNSLTLYLTFEGGAY